MNTITNTIEAVKEYLTGLDDSELVDFNNIYCRENACEDEIYYNDEEFFNTYFEGKILEAVRAVSYGDYNYTHTYVKFNGYGNLITFNNPSNEIDLEAIAGDILEKPENYDIELEDEEIEG